MYAHIKSMSTNLFGESVKTLEKRKITTKKNEVLLPAPHSIII